MTSTAPPSLPPALAAGRYRFERLLGIGTKKRVYLARDQQLDRQVAVALLRTEALDKTAARNILEEAQETARLGGHPGIVTIHDVGEEDGQPFVVSQYMAGGTLADHLRTSPDERLAPREALCIFDQLCEALEHAHGHGVVHRDLKPSNVWLSGEGTAKLGDFGLAVSRQGSRRPRRGRIVGTVAYMSPEQVLGRPCDPRSDLYSLGAVLYQMLAGHPPFAGRDAPAVLAQHLNTPPTPPSHRNPEVSPALDRLVLRLLAKSPGERPANAGEARATALEISSAASTVPPSAASGSRPLLQAVPRGIFVGRREEIVRLRRGLDDALAGRGRIILLAGDPGIGKTRTADQLAGDAASMGFRVLVGRCHEGEGAPAYWPWVQILRAAIAGLGAKELESHVGAQAADLAHLVTELRDRLPGLPVQHPPDLEAARFRLFDSITRFLKQASRDRPLLLLLDDLHWADKSSLLLFQFFAREIGESRLCLLGTYRDTEVRHGHPLAQILPSLRTPVYQRVLLRGLAENDVRELLASLGEREVPEDFARTIFRETEGNPFFIQEILRHLVEEGILFREAGEWRSRLAADDIGLPDSVREVIGRRLRRLSEPCRRVLAVAAVVGREFELRPLERVAEIASDRLLEALEEADEARVVTEVPRAAGRYAFTHALIREALYGELGTTHRVKLHRQIAHVLDEMHANDSDPPLAELAYHYFAASPLGEVEKAITFSTRAGDRAISQLAYEEAARHYERALRAGHFRRGGSNAERCDLVLKLGEAQWSAADFDRSKQSFKLAADLAETADQKGRAALGYSGLHPAFDVGFVDETVVWLLERALTALPPEDSALRARVMVRLAEKLAYSPDAGPEVVKPLVDEATEMARRVANPAALASVLSSRHFAVWRPENLAERVAEAREIVSLAEAVGDHRLAALGHLWRAAQSLEAGAAEAAEPEFAALERCAQAVQQPYIQWIAGTTRAMRAAIAGRFAEAEALAEAALAYGQERENRNAAQLFGAQLLFLRWEQGRLAELEETIASFAEQFSGVTVWRGALAWLLAEIDRPERAVEQLEILDRSPGGGIASDQFRLISLWLLGETTARLGDPARARALYEQILPFAARSAIAAGAVFAGSMSRTLGLLAATLGRFDDAESHLQRAAEVHERIGAKAFATRTRLDYARLLLARGGPRDREGALDLLRQALDEAQGLGMLRIVEQALALTMQAEGISLTSGDSSIDTLTASLEARPPSLETQAAPDGTVTLMLSDMEGFSAMTERLGDAQAFRIVKAHNAIIRGSLSDHSGFEVENQGDGFLIAFSSATEGLQCAIDVQLRLARHNQENPGEPIRVRIGLHTGEPIKEGGRFFGKTVILAARIAAQARGGEILVSSVLRQLTEISAAFRFGPARDVALKGLAGVHQVSAVEWRAAG